MENTKNSLPTYPCVCDMWDELKKETRPIIIYGMGNGADKLLLRLEKYGITQSDIFASDGFVRGHSFHGMRVKSLSEILSEYKDFVILLSFASNRREVLDMLMDIDKKYTLYIPDMPVAGDEYFDRDFYNKHYKDIVRAYELLSDDSSKALFAAVVNYKLYGKGEYLFSQHDTVEEIYLSLGNISSAVDAGAYNGDTVKILLKTNPEIKRIYAIEPDARNYRKLEKFVLENGHEKKVLTFNGAAWSDNSEGGFIGSGNRNSSVSSTASYQSRQEEIHLMRIDKILSEPIDFIKYDVEGAELEALIGSSEAIDKYRPKLLVSAYHRSRDVFSLITYISEKYPFYNITLRRAECVPAWELDILAIPKI